MKVDSSSCGKDGTESLARSCSMFLRCRQARLSVSGLAWSCHEASWIHRGGRTIQSHSQIIHSILFSSSIHLLFRVTPSLLFLITISQQSIITMSDTFQELADIPKVRLPAALACSFPTPTSLSTPSRHLLTLLFLGLCPRRHAIRQPLH